MASFITFYSKCSFFQPPKKNLKKTCLKKNIVKLDPIRSNSIYALRCSFFHQPLPYLHPSHHLPRHRRHPGRCRFTHGRCQVGWWHLWFGRPHRTRPGTGKGCQDWWRTYKDGKEVIPPFIYIIGNPLIIGLMTIPYDCLGSRFLILFKDRFQWDF